MYQIIKRTEADCDGGRTFYVIIDTGDNDREMSEWFETEKKAENYLSDLKTSTNKTV
jgi:uncharacterized protein YfcZ (UPF0381/DUF406 family)